MRGAQTAGSCEGKYWSKMRENIKPLAKSFKRAREHIVHLRRNRLREEAFVSGLQARRVFPLISTSFSRLYLSPDRRQTGNDKSVRRRGNAREEKRSRVKKRRELLPVAHVPPRSLRAAQTNGINTRAVCKCTSDCGMMTIFPVITLSLPEIFRRSLKIRKFRIHIFRSCFQMSVPLASYFFEMSNVEKLSLLPKNLIIIFANKICDELKTWCGIKK